MKAILSIFIAIAAAAAVAIGIGAYFWTPLDKTFEKIYDQPEEKVYEEEVEPEETPPEEDSKEVEEENTQNLITLAINCVNEDPQQCWKYLEKAVEKEPHNAQARIFRAQILEEVGKPSMAREEYLLAEAENPRDYTLAKEYAGFLMRTGRYDEAYRLMSSDIAPPSHSDIWLNALFFHKIYKPVVFEWKKNRIPQGRTKPLVRYLIKLPEEQYWNGIVYQSVPYNQDFSESQQSTYWLKLFEALDNQKESLALDLMNQNKFQHQSWNPQLEINLRRILSYRQNRTLQIDEQSPVFERFKKSAQKTTPLTYDLHELAEKEAMVVNYKIPDHMRQLLLSDEIFATALIDTGWDEAAIRFHRLETYPSAMPEWAAYRFTEALRANRGNLAALQFADKQNETPELNLLIAELLYETGDMKQAAAKLVPLSQVENATGIQAARHLAGLYIRGREFQKAKDFISRTPNLSNHVWGQELIARIFLEENQPELACQLYLSIEKDSSEAKSFLARRAYIGEDWNRAQKLTEELIAEYPDIEMFKQNLKRIQEKISRKKESE